MHLPKHFLAPMVKFYVRDAFFGAVFQRLHKKDLNLDQGEVGGNDLSQLVLVEPNEVDAVSHVVGSFNDVQKLGRNEILLLEPLHSPLQIRFVELSDLPHVRLYGFVLFSGLVDEEGIGKCEHSLVEQQFIWGDECAGIAFLEHVDGFAVSFVDVPVHVLQTEGPAHAQQMRRVYIHQHVLVADLLSLKK